MDDPQQKQGKTWFWLGLLAGLVGALYLAIRRSAAQLADGVGSTEVAGRVAGWTADLTPDETGWISKIEPDAPAEPARIVAEPAPATSESPTSTATTAAPAAAKPVAKPVARKTTGDGTSTPAQRRTPKSGGWTTASAGDCPADHPIKGNAGSGIYFLPGQPNYAQTRAEICFQQEGDAIAAGFRARKR